MAVRDPSPEEARRFASGPLSRELQYAVFQYAKPIYWVLTRSRNGVDDEIRNGTTFFLDCGQGLFGVTAGHVYDAFANVAATGVRCQIGSSTESVDSEDPRWTPKSGH